MKTVRDFRIPFIGLKLGVHEFEFTLDDAFFESFEFSEIDQASIQVQVALEKQTTMLVLDISLTGMVKCTCDRCGEPISIPVEADHRLVAKLGSETKELEDDLLVLGPAEHEIDLAQYLYESAQLALPARKVHEDEGECDPEAMAKLQKYQIDKTHNSQWAELKNLNYEDPEDTTEDLLDDEWEDEDE
ncbi:MAG: YceD family protein [Flavobacteriales bacterium]